MKHWSLVLLMAVAFAPGFVSAQDTAYKAVRAVGTQRGEKALNQITAVVGQSGRPQPVAWRISLDDPAARGGERELKWKVGSRQEISYAVKDLDQVTDEQRARRAAWLKGEAQSAIAATSGAAGTGK